LQIAHTNDILAKTLRDGLYRIGGMPRVERVLRLLATYVSVLSTFAYGGDSDKLFISVALPLSSLPPLICIAFSIGKPTADVNAGVFVTLAPISLSDSRSSANESRASRV
jgi:hypothetical protein